MLGLSLQGLYGAGPASGFERLSFSEAQRELTGSLQLESNAAVWVWTDKQVYSPGDPLTVRWTIKRNNDLYPYTVVAYRQNNQTGVKSYLPGNTQAVNDIFGRQMGDFQVVRLSDATKQVLVGQGGSLVTAPLTVPQELGMHTVVVQLRDYTGTRVVKSAYFKFGVVGEFVNLPNQITADTTLTNDKAYRIQGIVSVLNDATLTIQPGAIIIGLPGSQPPSVLLITTRGRIDAQGTRSRPIIMTSSLPIGQRQRGDWGGLLLLGDAPLNDPGGELTIEGLPEIQETRYGGPNPAHDCGTMRYVRVEFAGALLRPNEETNSITWGGCGTDSVGEYLQAHYGLDDSFEWFGGLNSAKYLVATYGADDFLDTQIGYRGKVQHFLGVSNEDLGNRGIESDNYERDFGALPRGVVDVWNATFVGGGNRGFDEADAPCLYFRRGAGGRVYNTVCYNWVSRTLGGANFDTITPLFATGEFAVNGLLSWNNGREAGRANTLEDQVVEAFRPLATGAGGRSGNFVFADPMMRRPLERSDPDFRPLTGSPAFSPRWLQPPDDGFLDQWATWAGAFGDVDWTEEWTTFIQEQDLAP
jgi:hypothetical protein